MKCFFVVVVIVFVVVVHVVVIIVVVGVRNSGDIKDIEFAVGGWWVVVVSQPTFGLSCG